MHNTGALQHCFFYASNHLKVKRGGMSVSISSHSLRQWVSLLGGCSYSGVASHLMCKPANSLHSAAHSYSSYSSYSSYYSYSFSVKALAAVVCGHTDICHCSDGHDVSWWWRLCESQQCFAFFWLIWFSLCSSFFLFLCSHFRHCTPLPLPVLFPLIMLWWRFSLFLVPV